MIYKDNPSCKSSSEDSVCSARRFVNLPAEILEQIYLNLALGDRLRLLQTCSTLREMWEESSTLQYQFTLETCAYLDIPEGGHSDWHPPNATDPAEGSSGTARGSDSDSETDGMPGVSYAAVRRDQDALHAQNSSSSSSSRDGPLSVREKTALLIDRERRWFELDPSTEDRVRVDGPAGVYELQEGVFLMCNDYSHLDEGRPTSIRLIPLPSVRDPKGSRARIQTHNHKLPFSIADLTMDPTQDLIVVSEHRTMTAGVPSPTHRYHLLSLSTFGPHPEAAMPVLDFPPFSQEELQTRQLLQVLDDVLVVLVCRFAAPPWILAGVGAALAGTTSDEEIVCWNWKTGKVLARMQLPDDGWFSSFALLTPTSFMLTSTSNISPVLPTEPRSIASVFPPVIQIFSFAPDPERDVVPVQPLDFDYMDDTTTRPFLVCQLELPRFASGVMIGAFDVRPDPAFTPRKGKPFTQDPEKGLLVFDIQTVVVDETQLIHQHAYELFVLRETLVNLAKNGEARFERARETSDRFSPWRLEENFSWEDWGVTNARLMNASMKNRAWVCSCSGYRFISLSSTPLWDDEDSEITEQGRRPQPRRRNLRLLDFSPFSVRKARNAVDHPPEVTIKVHDTPTVLRGHDSFVNDVTSALPYVEIVREAGVRANGVMMDDQRIIAVSTVDGRNGDWTNVRQDMTVYSM
ncbi:hypothetical protein BD324DRAFT_580515 [Kockovaella imperatae]|uniref:F-box domain-containing protein n=1 Tax=Kockovaella imperatae TaxID=4999 RepID=A0A1Y1UIA5_9TREE|nr:hypothetical protein BD324DRAFT_580515 [Kockovaella imperatae]ORX36815.1 hypothetical protein BD324DRAFT_580515 [Kockovaella imperatae]